MTHMGEICFVLEKWQYKFFLDYIHLCSKQICFNKSDKLFPVHFTKCRCFKVKVKKSCSALSFVWQIVQMLYNKKSLIIKRRCYPD